MNVPPEFVLDFFNYLPEYPPGTIQNPDGSLTLPPPPPFQDSFPGQDPLFLGAIRISDRTFTLPDGRVVNPPPIINDGFEINPLSGKPQDQDGNPLQFDSNGLPIDPSTGNSFIPGQLKGGMVNNIQIDPATGLPIDPDSGKVFDPLTGQVLDDIFGLLPPPPNDFIGLMPLPPGATRNPDGSFTDVEGHIVMPDGSVLIPADKLPGDLPPDAIINSDGSVTLPPPPFFPPGTINHMDGSFTTPGGQEFPPGFTQNSDGSFTDPMGHTFMPDGSVIVPANDLPSELPPGAIINPDGSSRPIILIVGETG